MDWRVKGLVQKVLSHVPGGMQVNDRLQRLVGELRDPDRMIDSKVVDDWVVLAGQLRELGIPIVGRTFVEVGTGWFPIFPLCFALTGARSCQTFDLHRHLDVGLTRRAIARLAIHLSRIAETAGVPLPDVEARYHALQTAETLEAGLTSAGIAYNAPADAAMTGLAAHSVDVVFSNSVLEHVPPASIAAIFREATRILRPSGVAIHSINCGDHYAYFDRSITAINYLQYSEQAWRIWNNDLLYQNRLRPSDFLDLAGQAGLETILVRSRPKEKLQAALASMRIAEEFRRYSPDELCTTSMDFAARPRVRAIA